MAKLHTYNFPTTIRFGAGSRRLAPETMLAKGLRRPLIVTDSEVAKLPFAGEIAELLRNGGLEPGIFAGFSGNPVKSHVLACLDAYRAHGADSILALGGGAPVDVAKSMAILVEHDGDLFDYEDRPDARPIDGPLPPIYAIPTTAGTGSEVGRSSVVSEDDTHRKRILFTPKMLPATVFADPELLLGLPPGVTAATGLDALTHLVETFLVDDFHPLCDGIALEGVRLVAESLVSCVEFARKGDRSSPEHLHHRGLMLNASMMGAIAFQKGLGVNHSCAHALSTVCDLHHGLANGIVLPYAMEFNRKVCEEKFARLAHVAGLDPSADAFLGWLRELNEKTGIPSRLSEAGVRAGQVDKLVDFAVLDACHAQNPRKVSREDFAGIFSAAL